MDHEQLTLPLFDPPAFEELITRQRLQGIRVSYNSRLRTSWNVLIDPLRRSRHLVVPPYFRDAPEPVKLCLIEWAFLARTRRHRGRSAAGTRRRELEARVFAFCRERYPLFGRGRRYDPTRLQSETRGCRHDLREVFESLNAVFFGSSLSAVVRWGRPAALMSHHTIKNALDGSRINVITISGVYNHPDVPRFAIEGIMYHEMCHIAVPTVVVGGKRVIHGRDFRMAENRLPCLREWKLWERTRLAAILDEQRRELRRSR